MAASTLGQARFALPKGQARHFQEQFSPFKTFRQGGANCSVFPTGIVVDLQLNSVLTLKTLSLV